MSSNEKVHHQLEVIHSDGFTVCDGANLNVSDQVYGSAVVSGYDAVHTGVSS